MSKEDEIGHKAFHESQPIAKDSDSTAAPRARSSTKIDIAGLLQKIGPKSLSRLLKANHEKIMNELKYPPEDDK